MKKFQKKYYQQNTPFDPIRKEGDTNIENIPDKKNKNTNHIGEYIDYEEIDNK